MPFLTGLLVAYAMNPAVKCFEKWGISRTFATCIMIFSFFSPYWTLSIYSHSLYSNGTFKIGFSDATVWRPHSRHIAALYR